MLVKKHYKKIIISLFIGLLVFGFLGFFNLSALQAQELDLGVEEVGEATGLSQGGGDLRVTIGRIIQAFLGFLGVIALAIVLYGGFLYMTAGGSQDKIDKAKKLLINAFIGLTIILASYAITSFVISRLTEAIGTGVEVSTGGDGYGPDGCQGGLCTSGGSSFIVKSISPTGDTDIRNVKVKINFSKAVNPASVNQENIQISKAGGNQFETQNLIPVLAEENNDNSTEILVAVSEDDDNFGGENGWLVCSEDYLGDTPMKLGYDLNTIDFTDIEEVKFVFESEISSEQSIFDVYCGDDIEEEVEQLKQAWLPNNGFNEIILPEACYSESNNVHIKFVRQGEGCLKMDQAMLQVQTKSQASDQENLVAGTLSVDSENGKAVVFSPEASCPEPNQDLACFEADSTYEVNIKAGGVKTLAGGFNGVSCAVGSQCSGQFTTGNLVDTAAPEVNISAPYDGQKLSINSNIFVDVSASDDSAVAGSKLYIDDEFYNEHLSNDVSQEYLHSYTWMAWLEQGYDLGQHNIKVQAMDIDDNTVEEDIDVYLLPEDCFDENGDIICGSPECGACDGDFCSSDAECAGECLFTCGGTGTTSCENDDDCDGEEACLGVCSSLPIISDIAPKKAGPGNLVSIVGFGFEAFQENDQPENNLVASR